VYSKCIYKVVGGEPLKLVVNQDLRSYSEMRPLIGRMWGDWLDGHFKLYFKV
jgi:hypothetical protein